MTAELITGDSPDGVTHVVTGGIVEHTPETSAAPGTRKALGAGLPTRQAGRSC
jgi:hypothetical protein